MKKILVIIVSIVMINSVFGFTNGVDDETVLYKSLLYLISQPFIRDDAQCEKNAKYVFDLLMILGVDRNKTAQEQGYTNSDHIQNF